MSAFAQYYAQAFPHAPIPQPRFQTMQVSGKEGGVPGATVDSPVRRGMRTLCIFDRSVFVFDQVWKQAGEPRQHAWLESGRCTAAASAIPVRKRLPESDIVELLEQQRAILARGRLLFAGNTNCAAMRAYPFKAKAIDLGSVIEDGEEMAGIDYAGERRGSAVIWVRRDRTDYIPWNVACASL